MSTDQAIQIVIALAFAVLLWDVSRRRAKAKADAAEQRRRRLALEPHAEIGEGVEAVAHDARNLLQPALHRLDHLGRLPPSLTDEQRVLVEESIDALDAVWNFLEVMVDDPRAKPIDAVSCVRLALTHQTTTVLRHELGGRLDIVGNPVALARVFSNLFVNAVEHAGRAEVGRDGDTIWISNPLRGDAPDDSIYNKRVSTKAGSSGLGLHLCRKTLAETDNATLSHAPFIGEDGTPWIRFSVSFTPPRRD